MSATRPTSFRDLAVAERRLFLTIQQLEFGHFERLKIQNGRPVLSPWPMTVQAIKFATHSSVHLRKRNADEFMLQDEFVRLFEYIRGLGVGEILSLEFRRGLPFAMQVELSGDSDVPSSRGQRSLRLGPSE